MYHHGIANFEKVAKLWLDIDLRRRGAPSAPGAVRCAPSAPRAVRGAPSAPRAVSDGVVVRLHMRHPRAPRSPRAALLSDVKLALFCEL